MTDPDKTKKIVGIVISLPLFIFGLGLILGLPWWVTLALTIAIPAVALVAWLKPSLPQLLPAQAPQAGWKSRIFGARGSLLVKAVAATIIGFLLLAFAAFLSPWPDKTISFNSPEDLNKIKIASGNWQVTNGALSGYGQFQVIGSENWDLGAIEIVPAETMPLDMVFYIGPHYKIHYWVGGPVDNYPWLKGRFYRADFTYEGRISMNGNYIDRAKKDATPCPIAITMSKVKWLAPIWPEAGDPSVSINGDFLIAGARGEGYKPFQGIFSLYSSSTVKIKEVKFYCGSLTCKVKNLFGR